MKNLKVEDDVSESEGNSKGSQQCRKNIERMEISIPYLDFYPCWMENIYSIWIYGRIGSNLFSFYGLYGKWHLSWPPPLGWNFYSFFIFSTLMTSLRWRRGRSWRSPVGATTSSPAETAFPWQWTACQTPSPWASSGWTRYIYIYTYI